MKFTEKLLNRLICTVATVIAVALCICSCSAPAEEKAQAEVTTGIPAPEARPDPSDLGEYTLIIPAESTPFEKWSAELLQDAIFEKWGMELEILCDDAAENGPEILIGKTNRPQSALFEPEEGEYCLFYEESKIAILARDHFIAAGAGELLRLLERNQGKVLLDGTKKEGKIPTFEKCRNMILLIGDGMGKGHIEISAEREAHILFGDESIGPADEKGAPSFLQSTLGKGQEAYTGELITLNLYGLTTDSAGAATSLATGKKTANGALGMIPADLNADGIDNEFSSVQNIREAAALKGLSTAVLSTDKITGATPNAFLVHHFNRADREVILNQQAALENTKLSCDHLWCAFDSNDLLSEFKKAVDACNDNEKGFFAVAEEAMIDKFSEKMDYDNLIRTQKRFDELCAFAATYAMMYNDTALIITADHETGGLTKSPEGVWYFESDGEHTRRNVPVFAMGAGTDIFGNSPTENTAVADFFFKILEE